MAVYKDEKNNTWYCQIWYKDWQGKRKHTTKTGFAREKDAKKYERDFLGKKQRQDPTIDVAAEEFKRYLTNERRLKNIKQTTYENKKYSIDHYILPYFKDTKISKITPAVVQAWLAHISTNCQLRERLSSATLNKHRANFKQLLDFCQREFKTEGNPVDQVPCVKKFSNDKRAKFWTLEQYQLFYDNLKTETHRVLFNIIFWSGMRIGECLALTPADFSPYKIRINKSTETTKEEGQLTDTPKNVYSVREVEIPRTLYFQIKNYIDSLYDVKPDTQIFSNFTADNIRYYLYYHGVKKLGLPKASTHTLRHSYASMLYNDCHDITIVAKQVGHGNLSTTLKFYAHMLTGKDRKAVDSLEEKAKKAPKNEQNNTAGENGTNFELSAK